MTRFNKILLFVNIAAIAALVLVVTVYAWNGPGASPPTGGGALSAATNAPKDSIVINADGTINATSTVTVGGGSGKINVGTVDPIYTIGGARYATYMAGMTGVKEEMTGVAVLRLSDVGRYEYVIDFSTIERGSDLWLFWQTTDFGADWELLSVLLSPAFEGKAWYRKDQGGKRLVFYADNAGEVSYRLTAARFDHAEWPNASTGIDQGFVLDEK